MGRKIKASLSIGKMYYHCGACGHGGAGQSWFLSFDWSPATNEDKPPPYMMLCDACYALLRDVITVHHSETEPQGGGYTEMTREVDA